MILHVNYISKKLREKPQNKTRDISKLKKKKIFRDNIGDTTLYVINNSMKYTAKFKVCL